MKNLCPNLKCVSKKEFSKIRKILLTKKKHIKNLLLWKMMKIPSQNNSSKRRRWCLRLLRLSNKKREWWEDHSSLTPLTSKRSIWYSQLILDLNLLGGRRGEWFNSHDEWTLLKTILLLLINKASETSMLYLSSNMKMRKWFMKVLMEAIEQMKILDKMSNCILMYSTTLLQQN